MVFSSKCTALIILIIFCYYYFYIFLSGVYRKWLSFVLFCKWCPGLYPLYLSCSMEHIPQVEGDFELLILNFVA